MNEAMLKQLEIFPGLSVPFIEEADYARTMAEVVEPKLAAIRMEKEIPVSSGTIHT